MQLLNYPKREVGWSFSLRTHSAVTRHKRFCLSFEGCIEHSSAFNFTNNASLNEKRGSNWCRPSRDPQLGKLMAGFCRARRDEELRSGAP